MSESLRNDGRVWVPKAVGETRHPNEIPENERDYYLERKYPSFGNLVPRDLASRNAKYVCDEGRGVGGTNLAVYLDFRDSIDRLGKDAIEARYGNLFDMYHSITDSNPYTEPMTIYPAVHYTMGGLWVDYNLMSNVEGLFVLGEANFSDHGANRLGASALMQGLADGYFVIPYTLGNYLANADLKDISTNDSAFSDAENIQKERINKLLDVNGNKSVDEFHRELGLLMWDKCGMSRSETGLKEALGKIPKIRDEFWSEVIVPGSADSFNPTFEKAQRVADFLEFSEIMIEDALDRTESCGGHFREESQTPEGEALRKDNQFSYVSSWEYKGEGKKPVLHKEDLKFEFVTPSTRSYK